MSESNEKIRETVRQGYKKIAQGGTGSCCGSSVPGKLAEGIGYTSQELEFLPQGANMGLSCGNPTALASIKPGEVVVDLGSGAGFEVFIAARKAGTTGRVIGIDMTLEMVFKARENAQAFKKSTTLDNVEFRLGEIEHLPIADGSADIVISNCVINLSPDKPQVWREIFRVLKPGGRVAVSDLALLKPLPEAVRESLTALVGCIAGAVLVEETEKMIKAAGLVDAVEMAEVVVGGADALRKKPILTCYINVVSGAVHNEVSLQKLMFLAEKGIPILYIPGSNAGVTSPMTMAGAVALDLAGGLVGLVLSQLKREGTPFIMSGMDPAALDMRTMVSPYAYPERGIIRPLSRRYGIPAFALAGGSDAKVVDQQAAAEAALTILADTLMGGNIVHDLGYLESGLTFSLAQLAICDQIVSWIKAFLKDVEVSEETLALDVIRQVGIEGQYLKTSHTRRHMKDHWYPDLFERGAYNDWKQKGGLSLGERAAERVQKILDEHHPEPLDDKIRLRLHDIVLRASSNAPS